MTRLESSSSARRRRSRCTAEAWRRTRGHLLRPAPKPHQRCNQADSVVVYRSHKKMVLTRYHDTPDLWAYRVFYVFRIQYRIIQYCIVQPGGGLGISHLARPRLTCRGAAAQPVGAGIKFHLCYGPGPHWGSTVRKQMSPGSIYMMITRSSSRWHSFGSISNASTT